GVGATVAPLLPPHPTWSTTPAPIARSDPKRIEWCLDMYGLVERSTCSSPSRIARARPKPAAPVPWHVKPLARRISRPGAAVSTRHHGQPPDRVRTTHLRSSFQRIPDARAQHRRRRSLRSKTPLLRCRAAFVRRKADALLGTIEDDDVRSQDRSAHE